MSFFKRLLGSESTKTHSSKQSSSAQAIEQLTNVEEMLLKRQEHLESQIEQEKTNAITFSRQGNKRGALNALKKKKKHEKTLAHIDGTLTTIEMQRDALRDATTHAEIFGVMTNASKALKNVHAGLDPDKVNEIMDDIAEQNQTAKDISDALASFAMSSDTMDDYELERELELLSAEATAGNPIDVSRLPSVPNKPVREKTTADELKELEAIMS